MNERWEHLPAEDHQPRPEGGAVPADSVGDEVPGWLETGYVLSEAEYQALTDARDPVVKYDGTGKPVRASEVGNRAYRRKAAQAAARARRRRR